MRGRVIGAQEREGEARKTGRYYHITILTYIYQNTAPGAFGLTADTVVIDYDKCPANSVKINADYELDFDRLGRLISLTLIPNNNGKS